MWEYKVIGDSLNVSGPAVVNQEIAQAQNTLNAHGAQGWELVTTEKLIEKDATGQTWVLVLYFFKRQK